MRGVLARVMQAIQAALQGVRWVARLCAKSGRWTLERVQDAITWTAEAASETVGLATKVATAPLRALGGMVGSAAQAAAPGEGAFADARGEPSDAPAVDRALVKAIRHAAAARADALEHGKPEEACERDRGIPAPLQRWLDFQSPDELQAISRASFEDIAKLVSGGDVPGIRPLSTRTLGRGCLAEWSAKGLEQKTAEIEELRQVVSRPAAPPVRLVSTPTDPDMAELHAHDQHLRGLDGDTVMTRMRAARFRREQREADLAAPAPLWRDTRVVQAGQDASGQEIVARVR